MNWFLHELGLLRKLVGSEIENELFAERFPENEQKISRKKIS